MSYIGRQLNNLSDRVKLDSITASATATYNLLLNSVAYVPSSAESLTVSLNGVIQAPQDSYTVSGSTITFASTLSASDSIDFILAERSITLQTPSSGSVNTEQLADSSVTLAKLSATGTKDATTFLRGDNTFASAGLSGWSENGADNDLLPSNADSGIYLGVNSATAANLLDHYEYGTWTPRLQGRTTQGTVNYSAGGGDGYYQRIGDIVHLWFWFAGSLSGASGELQMSGVPYNMDGGQTQYRINLGATSFAGRKPTFGAKFNNTTFELYEETGSQDASGIGFNNSNVSDVSTNTVQVWGSMTYKTV